MYRKSCGNSCVKNLSHSSPISDIAHVPSTLAQSRFGARGMDND